jgi:hypothetical protein
VRPPSPDEPTSSRELPPLGQLGRSAAACRRPRRCRIGPTTPRPRGRRLAWTRRSHRSLRKPHRGRHVYSAGARDPFHQRDLRRVRLRRNGRRGVPVLTDLPHRRRSPETRRPRAGTGSSSGSRSWRVRPAPRCSAWPARRLGSRSGCARSSACTSSARADLHDPAAAPARRGPAARGAGRAVVAVATDVAASTVLGAGWRGDARCVRDGEAGNGRDDRVGPAGTSSRCGQMLPGSSRADDVAMPCAGDSGSSDSGLTTRRQPWLVTSTSRPSPTRCRDERRLDLRAAERSCAVPVPADRGLRVPVRLSHRRAGRSGRRHRLAVRAELRFAERVRHPAGPAGRVLPDRSVRDPPPHRAGLRAGNERPGHDLEDAVGLDRGPGGADAGAPRGRGRGHPAHPPAGRCRRRSPAGAHRPLLRGHRRDRADLRAGVRLRPRAGPVDDARRGRSAHGRRERRRPDDPGADRPRARYRG